MSKLCLVDLTVSDTAVIEHVSIQIVRNALKALRVFASPTGVGAAVPSLVVIRAHETNSSVLPTAEESVARWKAAPNLPSVDPVFVHPMVEDGDVLLRAVTSLHSLQPSFVLNMAEARSVLTKDVPKLLEVVHNTVLLTEEEYDASWKVAIESQ